MSWGSEQEQVEQVSRTKMSRFSPFTDNENRLSGLETTLETNLSKSHCMLYLLDMLDVKQANIYWIYLRVYLLDQ